ncbi:hypothetical protein Tco_1083501, partial [Tanacetum coccineum]
ASEAVADRRSSSQRKRWEAYARLYKKVSDEWWCEPGHGDWSTCLEKYTLCRDGLYHKVIDLSEAEEIEYWDVVSSVSEGKQLDSVSMNSTPSWSSPSTSGSMEAGINNKVLLLRTMLQWEEQLRSEAGKLADVNDFGEIAVVSWPDGDILRLRVVALRQLLPTWLASVAELVEGGSACNRGLRSLYHFRIRVAEGDLSGQEKGLGLGHRDGLWSQGSTPPKLYSGTPYYKVNSAPSGFVSISPAPDPSAQDDPSVNKIHGSGSSSSTSMGVSGESSFGCSTMKSAKICRQCGANGNDFTVDLAKNLFKLASFPFNFCTSFKHFGDGRLKTMSTLSGHTFISLVLTLYPRNIPSSTPKLLMTRSSIYTSRFLPICLWNAFPTRR